MYTPAPSTAKPGHLVERLLLAVCCACLCATLVAQQPAGEGSAAHPASWDYFSQPELEVRRATGYTPPPPSEGASYAPPYGTAGESRSVERVPYFSPPVDAALPGAATIHDRTELERYETIGDAHRMIVDDIRRDLDRKALASVRDTATAPVMPPEDPR